MFKWNKKGLSGVVATVLLLLVTITLFITYSAWYQTYLSKKLIEYEKINEKDIEFLKLDASNLYLRSYSNIDLIYNTIKIDDKDCLINGTIDKKSITNINLGLCAQGMNQGLKTIKIESMQGSFFKDMLLRGTISGILAVLFEPSTTCPDISYTKIYAMNSLNNSHAELPNQFNYTYSVCVKSAYVNLGTSCSGTHTTLFYLSNVTDSHVYIDNSTAATEPFAGYYNWQKLCISSSDASLINTTIASSSPGSEYSCIGSVDQDDYNGGMIGDCSKYSDKIWIHIE